MKKYLVHFLVINFINLFYTFMNICLFFILYVQMVNLNIFGIIVFSVLILSNLFSYASLDDILCQVFEKNIDETNSYNYIK